MANLTPAERERLAIDGMGWPRGWLVEALPDECIFFETEDQAIQCRNHYIAPPNIPIYEAYQADGYYLPVAGYLPDHDIEQAMGLLDAMDAKEYAVRLEPFPRPGLGQYAVSFRKGKYVLDTDKVEVGPIAEAICRAVLAALEVK